MPKPKRLVLLQTNKKGGDNDIRSNSDRDRSRLYTDRQ